MVGIYMIFNTVNEKFYIGSSNDIARRLREHKHDLKNNKHDSTKLQNSYNKYGVNVFDFIIVKISTLEEYIKVEQYYIDTYQPEFNHAKSATAPMLGRKHTKESILKMSGRIMSLDQRKKLSEANSGKKMTIEQKLKLSKLAKGRTHSEISRMKISKNSARHNLGKTFSAETRSKMSKARIGKTLSVEHRQKISKSNLGRNVSTETRRKLSARIISVEQRLQISQRQMGKLNHNYGKTPSEETRIKLSKANSGINNGFYGKTHNEASRLKMSKAQSGKLSHMYGKHHSKETRQKMSKKVIDSNGNKFNSLKAVAKFWNIASCTVSNILAGRNKQTRSGISFRYA